MGSISEKLQQLLGARNQPVNTSAPASSNGTGKSVAASSKNKIVLLSVLSVVAIGGVLVGLRQYSTQLRSMRVTPGDPHLDRTVRTTMTKSSIVSSVEAEISNQNLNGANVNPEISYVAKKFNYKPIGLSQPKKLVDTSRVKSTVPIPIALVTAPPAVIAPVRQRVVNRAVVSKPRRKRETAENPSDPFNTVSIGEVEAVTTAQTVASSNTSSRKEVETTRFIPAAVYGKQMIRTGGKVRFRTLEAVTFQGVYIPRNTVLTAVSYLGSGRIQFQVPAQIVAGQKLPSDLMCVDKDYQTGITYNYDYIDDNMRQVGSSTVNDAVSSSSNYLNYSGSALGVAGQLGSTAIRGITNAVTSGKRQRSTNQVELQDGYQVFFKSTKN